MSRRSLRVALLVVAVAATSLPLAASGAEPPWRPRRRPRTWPSFQAIIDSIQFEAAP